LTARSRLAVAVLSEHDNLDSVIESFGNRLAEDLFDDLNSKAVRHFPSELRRIARRKLLYLHDAAALNDLEVPPGNRLEALRGTLKGFYSIRINDQWRIVFRWKEAAALSVQVVDYH
jgi:toxin HigB-1